jgi:hypothetical protein
LLPRAADCGPHGCCDTEPVPDCDHCPPGTRCCANACVYTQTDRTHCGTCGHACESTAICASGTCVSCPPGRVVCGNACCFPEA